MEKNEREMTEAEAVREYVAGVQQGLVDGGMDDQGVIALGKLVERAFLSACQWKDRVAQRSREKQN